jgi:hypothetical protein
LKAFDRILGVWVVEDVGITIDGVLWWMTVFLLDGSDRFLSGPYV